MASFILKNQTAAIVPIPDVGTSIAVSATITFTQAPFILRLVQSQDLRDLINAATFVLNDGTSDLTPAQAIVFLQDCWLMVGYPNGIPPQVEQGFVDQTSVTVPHPYLRIPHVTVLDDLNKVIIPDEIEHIKTGGVWTEVTVTFLVLETGTVIVSP